MGLDSRADSRAIRRRVGYLPGDFALYPRLSGAAMLDYLASCGAASTAAFRRARRAVRSRPPPAARGAVAGNRQKLGLIQAFMHAPELLILDEPIAGLDPLVQQSFHACSERWSRGAGRCSCPRTRCRRWNTWPSRRDPATGPAGRRGLARQPASDRRRRLDIEFAGRRPEPTAPTSPASARPRSTGHTPS